MILKIDNSSKKKPSWESFLKIQVGTVVDSPADFYHSRVPKKDRKKTLVDELMADANFQRSCGSIFFTVAICCGLNQSCFLIRYNKRKYADIIQAKPKPGAPRKLKKKK